MGSTSPAQPGRATFGSVEDRNRFDDIEDAIRSTTRHTGGALAGSAFTTAAGFGILVTSTLTPFRQMGQVTAYAIVLSLAGSVLVLPSLLVLWERWHRRRGDLEETKETVPVLDSTERRSTWLSRADRPH